MREVPPSPPRASTRRSAIHRIALPAAALALPALLAGSPAAATGGAGATTPLRLTPAQMEGPYYPVDLPPDTDFDLLRQGGLAYSQGQPAWLDGRVVDVAGQPVAAAVVEIWQCDAQGHYRHPRDGDRADPAFQAFGRVSVAADGAFRFRTIRPVAYDGRTPHIHVKVRLGRSTLLTTQLYVDGEPGNARDGLWRRLRDPADRAALTLPYRSVADGLAAQVLLVVQT